MHLSAFRTSILARRVLVMALGALVLLGTAAAPVAGVEPLDPIDPQPTQRPVRPQPTVAPEPAPAVEIGYDVSFPQCGDALPASFAFAIVGVNGGRVHRPNPCLGPGGEHPSQLEWAGVDADLYINTGNPGPEISTFWPVGQAAPRDCGTLFFTGSDTTDCAYVYGWNAAADSYRTALDAFIVLGWAAPDAERVPGDRTWWLDVETANSWRLDRSFNVAALQGAVDYLESMEVAEVGFYSTPLLWWMVTGGTQDFADHPAWHAGAADLDDARRRCDDEAFTGGELVMVQWVENELDTNHRCS